MQIRCAIVIIDGPLQRIYDCAGAGPRHTLRDVKAVLCKATLCEDRSTYRAWLLRYVCALVPPTITFIVHGREDSRSIRSGRCFVSFTISLRPSMTLAGSLEPVQPFPARLVLNEVRQCGLDPLSRGAASQFLIDDCIQVFDQIKRRAFCDHCRRRISKTLTSSQ
jgi:hypothetical protein